MRALARLGDRMRGSWLALVRSGVWIGVIAVLAGLVLTLLFPIQRHTVGEWWVLITVLAVVLPLPPLLASRHRQRILMHTDVRHWGPAPDHGALTQHHGARRDCPSRECRAEGR